MKTDAQADRVLSDLDQNKALQLFLSGVIDSQLEVLDTVATDSPEATDFALDQLRRYQILRQLRVDIRETAEAARDRLKSNR